MLIAQAESGAGHLADSGSKSIDAMRRRAPPEGVGTYGTNGAGAGTAKEGVVGSYDALGGCTAGEWTYAGAGMTGTGGTGA